MTPSTGERAEPDYLGRVVVLFVVALAAVLTMGAVVLSQ